LLARVAGAAERAGTDAIAGDTHRKRAGLQDICCIEDRIWQVAD